MSAPVYVSGSRAAKALGLARSAVYNAYERGAIKAAAFVDDVPVFTEKEIVEWRARRYEQRSPAKRGRKAKWESVG